MSGDVAAGRRWPWWTGFAAVMNITWRRLVLLRWLYIVACAASLVASPQAHSPVSIAILLAGAVYTAALQGLDRSRPDWLSLPYLSTTCDTLLGLAVVAFSGNISTAFTFLLFALAVTAAIRYGIVPALAMGLLVDGLDLSVHVVSHTMDGGFALRALFLILAIITTDYLRELLRGAELEVGQRLRQQQQLTSQLTEANHQLVRLDELKSQFLANVSHELRTPLTSIRSFSELLLSYPISEVEEREFLTIINRETERLTRLVNDVLDLSKIDSGRMDWRMSGLDLRAVLEEAARMYRPLVEQAGLTFRCELSPEPLPVIGDHDRLFQVLGNLLANALKFTSQGSITLGAEMVENEVWLSVRDSGQGIAPEDRGRIFQRFYQAETNGFSRGTGLGLTICHDIVVRHRGRIWVDSEMGFGSTFWVALPTSRVEARQPAL